MCVDEATANVDSETDSVLQSVLRSTLRGRTVLTIAHRVDTVKDSDVVIVMEAGVAVEAGEPGALAADPNSRFAELLGVGSGAAAAEEGQDLPPEADSSVQVDVHLPQE